MKSRLRRRRQPSSTRRKGVVLILGVSLLVVIIAFTAFTVDVGYISLTRGQMQTAADAGALAAAAEIREGLIDGSIPTSITESGARTAAQELVTWHHNGNHANTSFDPIGNVRLGQRLWNSTTQSWVSSWGVPPYNMVEVTVDRLTSEGTQLPLFFSPMIGHKSSNIRVKAAAAIYPASGFRISSTSSAHAPILPFTVDLDRWSLCLDGIGPDDYAYSSSTNQVTQTADTVVEVNIYPIRDGSLPAGNSGTVNFGNPSNSAADIARQILEGLSAEDLSYHGGELNTDNGPITVTGDPGISAGFQDELESIIGQVRAIPLFTYVTGQGANTEYQIVKFVGCRIMAVKLTGPLSKKHLIVQPERLSDGTAVRNTEYVIGPDTIFTAATLIE